MSSPRKQKVDTGYYEGSASFNLKNVPLDSHRRMKVRVVGAGYSGIYLGIRIPQRLRNIDLQIYEKNEGVGGTWWVNKYPGVACDIPAHSYQYSFNPNPNWSSFYAPGSEICAYLEAIAKKYGAMRFVKLSHEVISCTWDNEVKRCYDFRDKRVGIIGNGSSAIQIVPSLQKIEGAQLSCFVRSKTWITNPFGDAVMNKLGLDPKQLDFSPEQRQEFAQDPAKLFNFRKEIEVDGNTIHEVSFRDSDMQRGGMALFRAAMQQRLAPRPEIAEFLIPSFG
ncbi:hypothetical protein CHU98_g12545, partial [Xylaria longipes]